MTHRLSKQESREVRTAEVNSRLNRGRHELIGHLLDKGHDLRVEGEAEKADACFQAAGDLVRAGS